MWLVWPNAHARAELEHTLRSLELATFWPTLAGTIGLLGDHALLPRLALEQPAAARSRVAAARRQLLAISSVGFMAILALPARLGEFVRPALLSRRARSRPRRCWARSPSSASLDGLVVSLLVFGCCLAFTSANPSPRSTG
jgi:hypothetical protein